MGPRLVVTTAVQGQLKRGVSRRIAGEPGTVCVCVLERGATQAREPILVIRAEVQ